MEKTINESRTILYINHFGMEEHGLNRECKISVLSILYINHIGGTKRLTMKTEEFYPIFNFNLLYMIVLSGRTK